MKRILLAIAMLTVSFGGSVPAQACVPNDPTNGFFCNYLKIPQSACFNALSHPSVPQPVRDAKPCEKVPAGATIAGQDLNIGNAGSAMVFPDSGSVGIGRSVFVHNLDISNWHTFTDLHCLDNNAATPCRFDKTLLVGSWGLFANTVQITTANKFEVGKTYNFKCTEHAGEVGSFTVTP